MNFNKLYVLLVLMCSVVISFAQTELKPVKFPVNKNLSLTVNVRTIGFKHYLIPTLKVFSDTQNIEIPKQILYGNEVSEIADCKILLKKIIKNQSVNMYINRLVHPDLDSFGLRKFTCRDSIRDTVNIENFIELEPGHYVISLILFYYLNGERREIESDQADFFIRPQKL